MVMNLLSRGLINQAFRMRAINPACDPRGCSPPLDSPFNGARSKLRGLISLKLAQNRRKLRDRQGGLRGRIRALIGKVSRVIDRLKKLFTALSPTSGTCFAWDRLAFPIRW